MPEQFESAFETSEEAYNFASQLDEETYDSLLCLVEAFFHDCLEVAQFVDLVEAEMNGKANLYKFAVLRSADSVLVAGADLLITVERQPIYGWRLVEITPISRC